MPDRASILAFIERKAALMRAQSDQPGERWALLRHDATVLEALASDIRAELDRGSDQ